MTDAQTHGCGVSLEDHILAFALIFVASGIGLKCEDAYKALLVIAEEARIIHGFAPFDPVPLAIPRAEEIRRLHAEEEQRLKQTEVSWMARDDGKVN